MAILRPLGKIAVPLSHLPTWFFIIGYPLYWLQLYTHSAADGVTSPLSWILFGLVVMICCLSSGPVLPRPPNGKRENYERFFWFVGLGISLFIIAIVALASFKPIHLVQEFDCLQYHYTIPRQHLILGSFAHIPWSADDLFLLPVEFALAPFWFSTVLPNKIPQLIIIFGLLGVVMRLTHALDTKRRFWIGPFAALFILATHGFGIQMGTGMLDLAIAYLFLASLDSLREGDWFWAGAEFTFFYWSKSLMPLEALIIAGIWGSLFALARWGHWQKTDIFVLKHWQRAFGLFMVLSVAVGGPFVVKSIYYAGTPFFPLHPGILAGAQIKTHPQTWMSLQAASQQMLGQNSYGYGRDLLSFIKHWWLLAVPVKGVNNAFDYPLGLTYLLMMGPFLFFLIKDIFRRRFSPLAVLAAVVWILWWCTSQQSRFLYIPLLLIFIVTIARMEKVSKILFLCLLISLSLEAVSLWGAHKADMGRWGVEVLRTEDKYLLALNHRYFEHSLSSYIVWPTSDVAFAQFPVMVHKEDLPHTILY